LIFLVEKTINVLFIYLFHNIIMSIQLNEIDKKRQKNRKETWLYNVDEDSNKEKFFALDMFPYPSWAWLHVWHPKWYIATDIVARKKLLEWYNVLHPMWRDAFWLPAENYAIKHKIHPSKSTNDNIARYKSQLEWIWFSYDRNREINTTNPKFYKWTQRAFLKMYKYYYDDQEKKAMPIDFLRLKITKWEASVPENMNIEEFINWKRLAYVDYKPIIWCPKCKTWLAQEDLEDWKCERCDSEIEMKPMRQWVLRITKYADRLLDDMDLLDEWPTSIKEMQKNRIWKSKWTEFDLEIVNNSINKTLDKSKNISVYTTRIDTVFGMAFIALAPEHPLIDEITSDEFKKDVSMYVNSAKKKSELQRTDLNKNKTWVFCWAYAVNPFNGKKVPIYIADYVVSSYWSWAVMAVPAHDERDYEFAMKYWIDFEDVIAPVYNLQKKQEDEKKITGVVVVLFDPEIQKYACLEMGKALINTNNNDNKKKYILITWWRDWIESFEETAKREAHEEWWIVDIKHTFRLWDCIYSRYHHVRKRDNRFSEINPFLIVTDSKNIQKQKLESHEKDFKLVRMDADEMMKTFVKTIPSALHIHDVLNRWVNKAIKEWLDKTNNINDRPLKVYTQKWVLFDSDERNWLESDDAIKSMNKWLKNKWIWKEKKQYKLQERVFSRQRYRWEPIPMIHIENKIVAMSESDLPLTLPEVEHYEPTGTEEWPLANIDEWINVDINGQKWKRESNTMPQRAWSSWYRLRYMDPNNENELVNSKNEKYRWQVDIYVWWTEHATRHLIYARFWYKFLYDIGIVSNKEPFKKLRNVGMILAEDWRKMSKRRWNVINPDDIISEFGADTLRVYEMFMWPFEHEATRSTAWLKWARKFLEKVIKLSENIVDEFNKEKVSLLHKTIKKVWEDIDEFKFNTAISQMMIFVNNVKEIDKKSFEKFILLLSPFAPHLAEEFWSNFWHTESIFNISWPKYNPELIVEDKINLAVQFNGKMRGTIEIVADIEENDVLEAIKADERLVKYLTNKLKKVIYVKWKIINVII